VAFLLARARALPGSQAREERRQGVVAAAFSGCSRRAEGGVDGVGVGC